MKIAFGTDGWRARIDEADGFCEANVRRVIQALADYWKREGMRGSAAVVGYDRRRDSEAMAAVTARLLAANGFPVLLSEQFCPTPTVSWMVKGRGSIGGVVITASHNPWQWNGVKFKESYGGSASPEYTQAVESLLPESVPNMEAALSASSLITTFDPHPAYHAELKRFVDIDRIRASGIRILHDPMYGAGSGFLTALLPDTVREIHAAADFRFGGLSPEPVESNLRELSREMQVGRYDLGVANDGDADRIGAVDERGRYITSQQIFALILHYVVTRKGLTGPVVKSCSTTRMIDRLGERYGFPVHETPIGFKHICKKFVALDALVGGEESGGIGFGPHVYERDGVLNALFLAEMVATCGKTMSELIAALEAEFGPLFYERLDLHLDEEVASRARKTLGASPPRELAGRAVTRTETLDGLKLHIAGGAWLLLRFSGTEPLVRIYAEAESPDEVKELIQAGKSFLID